MANRTATTKIQALHADEVRSFLERAGVAEAYDADTLRCTVCGGSLVDDGIGAARVCEDHLIFACGRPSCMREFA